MVRLNYDYHNSSIETKVRITYRLRSTQAAVMQSLRDERGSQQKPVLWAGCRYKHVQRCKTISLATYMSGDRTLNAPT